MILNLKEKYSAFIKNLRSQPYERRVWLLQISLIIVLCLLLIWWIFILKNTINKSQTTFNTEQAVVENNIKKENKISQWDIFKNGLSIIYQNDFKPFFQKIGKVALEIFSVIVGIVIKISQGIDYIFTQLTTQFKAYGELIYSLFKNQNIFNIF